MNRTFGCKLTFVDQAHNSHPANAEQVACLLSRYGAVGWEHGRVGMRLEDIDKAGKS
jgi:hypothetical protein